MGEYRARSEPDEVRRLQQECQELLQRLWDKLDELDQVRARHPGRHASPEERRRAFRVLEGGAIAIVAALVGLVHVVRKPVATVTAGAGLLTTSMLVTAPVIQPAPAVEPPPPVTPIVEPAPVVVEDATPVHGEPRPEPEPEVTEAPPPTPRPDLVDTPTSEPVLDPEPAPTPNPTPTPSPTPSPTVDVDIDVDPDLEQLLDTTAKVCAAVGLPPTADLAVCVEKAQGLGLKVDVTLLDKLGLDLGGLNLGG